MLRPVPIVRAHVGGLLLAALSFGLLAAQAPAAFARGPLLGLQSSGVVEARPAGAYDRDLARQQRLGAKIVRAEVSWAALEPRAAGEHDAAVVASLDDFVKAANAHRLRPILSVNRTPCWASSAPEAVRGTCSAANANRPAVWRYAPTDPRTATPILRFIAERYGSKLAAIQLWNEPDQSNEKYWAGPDKVARYVTLAKSAYPAIKAVAPKVPVLAGSFVGTDGRWLEALYAAGIKGYYDGLAVQFYDLPLMALRKTRQVQRRYGDRKPLWMTEFGYTSCSGRNGQPAFLDDHPCVTRQVQAQNLRDLYAAVRGRSWIKAMVMYTLDDQTRAYQFGVYDRAGRRKPSFAAVRNAMHGKVGTLRRPRVALRRSGNRLVITGTAPGIDLYRIDVNNGRLRYLAAVRTDRLNRFSVKLPAVLGTSGVRAVVRSEWSGRTGTASR